MTRALYRGSLAAGALVCAFALTATGRAETYTTIDIPGASAIDASAINKSGATAGSHYAGGHHGFARTAKGKIATFGWPKATNITVTGINSDRVIAGFYTENSYSGDGASPFLAKTHAFVRTKNGTITEINFTGSASSSASGINKAGVVTGQYEDGSVTHGFVRAPDGTITTFDPVDSVATFPASVNDSGTIAGSFYDGSTDHSFLRASDGTLTTFDVPGAVSTEARAINKSGAVAGQFHAGSKTRGFVRAPNGAFTTFDLPAKFPDVHAMNDAGVVVGEFRASLATLHHGFVRAADGTMTTFDPVGSTDTRVFDINSAGVIVGSFFDGAAEHGFLRTP